MNSSEWKKYPLGADFPWVAECPECRGMGLRISDKWVSSVPFVAANDSSFYRVCDRCKGTGKIIPPEWIEDSVESGR